MLLDAEVVPSLSALGLCFVTDAWELEELKQSQICNLLPQIDALFVHSQFYALAEDTILAGFASRTLIDTWSHYLDRSPRPLSTAHHLRIRTDDPSQAKVSNIEKISPFIETEGHHLRSIYFDTSLHPAHCKTMNLSRRIKDIVAECEKRDIEVVFEMQDDYLDLNPYISEEFSARQRKRRMAETG
jgi:hypothetical protein